MFILMGIWEGHEPYLTPLDSNDTRGLDWEQADRRRPMFQVLANNTKDCVPLPNNHFFAMVMDADSPMAKACPQSPFVP